MQLCGRPAPLQQALFLLNLVCIRHLCWILLLGCLLCFLGQNRFQVIQEQPAGQQNANVNTSGKWYQFSFDQILGPGLESKGEPSSCLCLVNVGS